MSEEKREDQSLDNSSATMVAERRVARDDISPAKTDPSTEPSSTDSPPTDSEGSASNGASLASASDGAAAPAAVDNEAASPQPASEADSPAETVPADAAARTDSPQAEEPQAEPGGDDSQESAEPGSTKIGTQRADSPAAKARPRPLSSVIRKAVAKHESASKQTDKEAEAPQESGLTASDVEVSGVAADSAVGGEPSDASSGESTAPESPPPSPSRVLLPSKRDTSAEEEQEVQAAIGDESLSKVVEEVDGRSASVAGDAATAKAAPAAGAPLEKNHTYQGSIISIRNDDVFVEVGQRQLGVVPMRQFEEEEGGPQLGQTIDVLVAGYDSEDNLYQFTRPGASVQIADWSQAQEGAVVEAHITGWNKGGLECQVNSLRGFIPAGQASLYHVPDLSTLIGERMQCLVLEANPQRRNLVLSRRAVMEREQAEARRRLLEEIKEGQVRDGIVRKIMDFGVFVDLGGIDGLLHVSKMSWERVHHPRDLVAEGDTIKVQVERIDWDKKRISLSMRELQENPWSKVPENYPPGSHVQGKVTRIMDFGAFVELETGIEGLVHISQLSHSRVWRVSDVVTEGDVIEAEVMSIDPGRRRIALSMKALEAPPTPSKSERPDGGDGEDTTTEGRSPQDSAPPKDLKGGVGRGSGGEHFGLKW